MTGESIAGGGVITITGGTVTATGAELGSGIGGGFSGAGGTIKINYPSGDSTGSAAWGAGPGYSASGGEFYE